MSHPANICGCTKIGAGPRTGHKVWAARNPDGRQRDGLVLKKDANRGCKAAWVSQFIIKKCYYNRWGPNKFLGSYPDCFALPEALYPYSLMITFYSVRETSDPLEQNLLDRIRIAIQRWRITTADPFSQFGTRQVANDGTYGYGGLNLANGQPRIFTNFTNSILLIGNPHL